MKKLIILFLAIGLTGCALLMPKKAAANTNISGTVESRCEVVTDIPGYFGNPNAYTPVSYTHLTLPTTPYV